MNDNFIRNREGKIVGRETSDGWLRDGTGKMVAKVDADGYTRTREGKIVGKGDQRLRELGKWTIGFLNGNQVMLAGVVCLVLFGYIGINWWFVSVKRK